MDLLNVHSTYLHPPNLGHLNNMGARGENTIIQKIPVSSSFGKQAPETYVVRSRRCSEGSTPCGCPGNHIPLSLSLCGAHELVREVPRQRLVLVELHGEGGASRARSDMI